MISLLLVNNFKIVKICDFGSACAIHTDMTVAQGSVAWMAPEVFKGKNYTEKCDIFSWAITFWQILARKIPYFNIDSPMEVSSLTRKTNTTSDNGNSIYQNNGAASFRIMWAVHGGERPQLLRQCPEELEILLESCWSSEPHARPTIDDVIVIIQQLYSFVHKWVDQKIVLPNYSASGDFN